MASTRCVAPALRCARGRRRWTEDQSTSTAGAAGSGPCTVKALSGRRLDLDPEPERRTVLEADVAREHGEAQDRQVVEARRAQGIEVRRPDGPGLPRQPLRVLDAEPLPGRSRRVLAA